MSEVLASATGDLRQLDERSSREVLTRAVARRAGVRLLVATGGTEAALSGVLVGDDEHVLTIELEERAKEMHVHLGSAALHVSLEMPDTTYFFETSCSEDSADRASGMLPLARPNTLRAFERRRSGRKSLRGSTEVTLSPVGLAAGVTPDQGWQCKAVMLNVSPEGMACRVRRIEAQRTDIGQTVRAVFNIGLATEPFIVTGQITNVTLGSTPDTAVLGMTFVDSDNPGPTKARLREALRNTE